MIGARRWALDGEERTWARGEVSPGSGHARADASLRRPGGVTRERERAVLPDQRLYGKTALQWCPASLRTLPAFNWKWRHRGPAARAALTASLPLLAYDMPVVRRVATGYHTSTSQCKPTSNQQDKDWTNWLAGMLPAHNPCAPVPRAGGSVVSYASGRWAAAAHVAHPHPEMSLVPAQCRKERAAAPRATEAYRLRKRQSERSCH